MNIHKLKKSRDQPYSLEIVDIMGIELSEGEIKPEDVLNTFEGHILDGYTVST